GTNRLVECVGCGVTSEPAPAMAHYEATQTVPTCGACGGWLKMATISFGQPLKPEVIERGFAEAERCDLVLALGSPRPVPPAAPIPLAAVRRRVPYVVVNRGPTDHDDVATLRLEGDVAAILPPAVEAISSE